MESVIRIVVVIVLILVAAAVIIGLVSMWSGNANATVKGFFDWFKGLFAGQSHATEGDAKKTLPSSSPEMPFVAPPG